MASVSGHMQLMTDDSMVEGEGGGGDDSIRVSLSSSSAAPVDSADKRDLMFWWKRLQWLEAEVDKHKVQLVTLKKLQSIPDEIDNQTKTRDLQKQLMQLSTDRKIIQSLLHSLELGQKLVEIVQDGKDGKDSDENLQREILETVERTTESVSNILRIHKEIESQHLTLTNLKEECVVLQQENRKFMYELQRRLESERLRENVPSENQKIARIQKENEALAGKIDTVTFCLQGLIFGSGVNWANDHKLRDFILDIDRPSEDRGQTEDDSESASQAN